MTTGRNEIAFAPEASLHLAAHVSVLMITWRTRLSRIPVSVGTSCDIAYVLGPARDIGFAVVRHLSSDLGARDTQRGQRADAADISTRRGVMGREYTPAQRELQDRRASDPLLHLSE